MVEKNSIKTYRLREPERPIRAIQWTGDNTEDIVAFVESLDRTWDTDMLREWLAKGKGIGHWYTDARYLPTFSDDDFRRRYVAND